MIIPFGSQSYQHESRQLSSQRMVNCFLEAQAPGSKAPIAVIRSPGISLVEALATGPVRGHATHNGVPYFVSGERLYSFDGTTATDLGYIPGISRVDMFSNTASLGILANKDLYVYETSLVKVTDEGFAGAIDVAYLDLFAIFAKEDSQDFFINNPGATSFPDISDYNALDSRTAEAGPGNIVALATDHRELFIFKETNTEIWTNTGNADFPFGPVGNAYMELGTIAKESVAKADNTLFWLANDMTVRRVDGYTPVRVSTHAIENEITKMTTRSDAFGFSYPFNGHLFYVLTFPTEDKTFQYDITTGLWAERETEGREWRVNGYVYANDSHYVTDSQSGNIGQLSVESFEEYGDVQRVSATSPPIHSGGRQLFFKRLHMDFEMGQGITTGQGSDPQVMLQWSDDGGKTWSSEHWRSIGKTGEYGARAVWNRLGSSNNRVFRVSFSDPSPFTLIQAIADVEGGEE